MSYQEKELRKARRYLYTAIGLALVSSAIIACWIYLAPVRHTLSPDWRARHSKEAFWSELQKQIHRGFWFHDDGFYVGYYGDKTWADWIMSHVESGDHMGCTGARYFHSASAMSYITNQDVGQESDDWLAWWEANREKNQRRWIEEGFKEFGFSIQWPARPEHYAICLTFLKPSATNDSAIPEYIKFNAFRALRDGGFDPAFFHGSSAELASCMDEFSRMKESLDLSEHGLEAFEEPPPLIASARFSAALLLIGIAAGMLAGLFGFAAIKSRT